MNRPDLWKLHFSNMLGVSLPEFTYKWTFSLSNASKIDLELLRIPSRCFLRVPVAHMVHFMAAGEPD